MEFEQIEKGWRIYKTEIKARKFAEYRRKKYNYSPSVYETIGKEWGVLY